MTVPLPRRDLATPALIVDRAALTRNIAAMAAFAEAQGVALRPHAKTHKSGEIARRQIAAGAAGICCAKLAEAEALAADGVANIHLTSPVVTPAAIERLAALSRRIALSVVIDHPDNARAIGAAAGGLTVFIDVDPGSHRTGVTSAAAAVALARAIAATGTLVLGGVQFYCGSHQHIQSLAERRAAIVERTDYLRGVLDALGDAGFAVPIVTGGGTGTFAIDASLGLFTELQVGSYIFLDREYVDCELAGPRFEPALFVDATVVSANTPGMVTIDAGLKAFATDAGVPVVLAGAPDGSGYAFTGDEHGALRGDGLPQLGARVSLMPPHCDPTVNLYDRYFVLDGGMIVDSWPVTARGCSS
ncbi:D-serine deaminase-like pyridoxal phosphate-dependent protein [Sphingomonas naasensis]|uniref:DSD1 family PLP-dependent enzyme n=1 Tax=Sphingomonas naasensis TaxID=1344951 RepID=A0A4S1WMI9_9SPHN|nr:alanine racemase [Sphingomonas naasensis]NIJ21982.1 D-serine deaminase-like pyridoxal phosphate-dependent protein [Sphingomonas naasensis]TGX42336.1 DSD1 family PLP-dependent enzyme [Sphingomonas naasensis]